MEKNIKTSSFQNYFITCTHKDISMLEDSNENFTIEDFKTFLDIPDDIINLNPYIGKDNLYLFQKLKELNQCKQNNNEKSFNIEKDIELVREAIVLSNLKLVNWCIRNFFSNIDLNEEEFQIIGLEGLVAAINNFDCSLNNNFSSYAVVTIIRTIKRGFKDIYGVTWDNFIAKKALIYFRELMCDLGYSIESIKKIEDTLFYDLTPNQIENLDNMIDEIFLLSDIYPDIECFFVNNEFNSLPCNQSDYDLIDQYEDNLYYPIEDNGDIVLERLIKEELKDDIAQVLMTIQARQQKVINEYYGLNGPKYTFNKIAEQFNLSCERIRQIHDNAIDKLKKEYLEIPNFEKESKFYDDYIYNKLLYLQSLNISPESMLVFMNFEGLDWTLSDMDNAIKQLDDITSFVFDLKIMGYFITEIVEKIKEQYNIHFSKQFIKDLLKRDKMKYEKLYDIKTNTKTK